MKGEEKPKAKRYAAANRHAAQIGRLLPRNLVITLMVIWQFRIPVSCTVWAGVDYAAEKTQLIKVCMIAMPAR